MQPQDTHNPITLFPPYDDHRLQWYDSEYDKGWNFSSGSSRLLCRLGSGRIVLCPDYSQMPFSPEEEKSIIYEVIHKLVNRKLEDCFMVVQTPGIVGLTGPTFWASSHRQIPVVLWNSNDSLYWCGVRPFLGPWTGAQYRKIRTNNTRTIDADDPVLVYLRVFQQVRILYSTIHTPGSYMDVSRPDYIKEIGKCFCYYGNRRWRS